MSNATNTGTLIGRLASDPKAFLNADGSKKVMMTLYVERGYKGADNKPVTDQISVEAFVSNKTDGLGPFAYVHQGDLVSLLTHIEQQPYRAKNGETVYPDPKIAIDDIQFLESRTVTQTRMARRAAGVQDAEAAGAAPAETTGAEGAGAYDTDAPFGAPVGG